MEAAETEMEAEEKEHVQRINKNLEEEHTEGLKQKHRDILKQISDQCPQAQQMALQHIMEDYRQDMDAVDQELSLERQRQLSDVQVLLLL